MNWIPTIGAFLAKLRDCLITSPANGDTLQYNSTTGKWNNAPAGALADGSVTNAKLANMANGTIKLRKSSGSGPPEDGTAAELRTLLDLANLYLAKAGGAVAGTVQFNGMVECYDYVSVNSSLFAFSLAVSGGGNITVVSPGAFVGPGSGITGLNASELGSGTVPAVRLADRVIFNSWSSRFVPGSSSIGEAPYDHASLPLSVPCAKSASPTLQSGTFRHAPVRAPYGFADYATTGAITLKYLADDVDAADAKITGIVVYGSNDLASFTPVYSDTTARNVSTINTATAVSIDRASLASTTVFAYYVAEVSVAVRSSRCIAILSLEVNGR